MAVITLFNSSKSSGGFPTGRMVETVGQGSDETDSEGKASMSGNLGRIIHHTR